MRAFQKIVRNGNATAVAIPRAMLRALNWLPGDYVMIEAQEDQSVRIRRLSREAMNGLIHRAPLLDVTDDPKV